MAYSDLIAFVAESNAIEGIHREPSARELEAFEKFLKVREPTPLDLGDAQAVFAPDHPLRISRGMDVYVGDYVAPPGGPNIVKRLGKILLRARSGEDPWKVHIAFEKLHPYLDGNGRSGRLLWAWNMRKVDRNPFQISFLHRFYYQTLANN